MENQLRREGPVALQRQVFPELTACGASPVAWGSAAEVGPTIDVLLRVMQLMENVHALADMDIRWNNPANLGWMNYMQRWAFAPAFRMWWPILKPMYNPRFRRFMEDHFLLPTTLAAARSGSFYEMSRGVNPVSGSAWKAWQTVQPQIDLSGKEVYALDLNLEDRAQTPPRKYPLQVAVSLVSISPDGKSAEWQADELYVLPGLWGSGIGSIFVRRILAHLRQKKVRECGVILKTSRRLSNAGSRAEHLDHIDFYRSLGFCLDSTGEKLKRSL